VAQRIGWPRLFEDEAASGLDPRRASDRLVAPIGTAWGRDGQALATSQARLASNVAARVIGPHDLPKPSGEQPKPSRGSAAELPPLIEGCNARAVVALWLAVRASPHVAVGLRRQVADGRYPFIVFANDVGSDEPIWGVREAEFALALLERPSDQVAQTLWRNWDLLMAPATTLERLGELVGVQPPPHRAPAPEFGDKLC
jgi:hypothetical protein